MENWRRDDHWDATGLYWTNPSPNMRNSTQALLYPGVGLLEFTNVSVGRGTDTPFEIFGAPWLDASRLAQRLNAARIPGTRFVPVRFQPTSSVFAGKPCEGVRILVTERNRVDPLQLGMHVATALHQQHANDWDMSKYGRLLQHTETLEAVHGGENPASIEKLWKPELDKFRARRAKYLMY